MVNAQTEMNCLHVLMTRNSPELLVKLDASMFGNEEMRKLFLLIKACYVERGSWPGWDVLRSIVEQKSSSADKARFVLALLDQIEQRKVGELSDSDLVAEMVEGSKLRTLLSGIQEVVLAAEVRDVDKALALFNSLNEKLVLKGSQSVLSADLLSLAGSDVRFNWRTTGIEAIDERNGVSTGSLVLLCGDTGTGKSTHGHSIGIHQHLKYADSVAYWSWEQGKKEIMGRIWSHQSEVDLGDIISDELDCADRIKMRTTKLNFLFEDDPQIKELASGMLDKSEEEFIRAASGVLKRRGCEFYIYDHGPNFDQLLVEMELLRSVKGVRLFIVDYLTLIPAGAEMRGMQSWEMYIKMSQRLKSFARRNDVIVITPLQFDAKEGTIRFSKNIINDADLALFMSQDEEDREMGTVTHVFAKYRNFKSIPNKPLESFKLLRSFNTAKFVDIRF